MDTNITALKAIYVALGGSSSTVANMTIIPDVLNAIATLLASGEFGILPSVDSGDNGKVLSVVEGAWAAANAPTELPAVTAEDNGDVLTVVKGAWDKASLPE